MATGGPISLVLAFLFTAAAFCPTVLALGEMTTFLPKPGAFVEHARMFVDEAWAAALGWK